MRTPVASSTPAGSLLQRQSQPVPKPDRPVSTAAPITVPITSFAEFAQRADYSLLESLRPDPQASGDGRDHQPRQVFSGHYVPVTPTPLPAPEFVAHSSALFQELGLGEALAHDESFLRLFSGDISVATGSMRPYGWATGYALSIYGSEYIQQCPFGTGNGYGDGRAISVFEGLFDGRRWELQLKGGGPTPYAAAPMVVPCCARVCANFWPRNSCMPWGFPPPAR